MTDIAEAITVRPIGVVSCSRSQPVDDDWDREQTWIELDQSLPEEALAGLAAFSHVEVIYLFHGVAPAAVEQGARHPRGNPAWPPVGIFAQRAKNRPNRLGLTVCQVVAVEGRRLRVHGLDAIDGTPVLDLKPWMREFAPRGEVRQPEWAGELMRDYWTRGE